MTHPFRKYLMRKPPIPLRWRGRRLRLPANLYCNCCDNLKYTLVVAMGEYFAILQPVAGLYNLVPAASQLLFILAVNINYEKDFNPITAVTSFFYSTGL